MKTFVIGTAGHIDHGKTALIRALTGTDPDRLPEEKQRGVTTDLGFARLSLPGGIQAGIIDVPGHKKFIRNMLAGAGALDLVLMAVAADEGVMPQTREHLVILELLGASHGIVVLTKSDLADAETLSLARDEAAECFAGSFLEHAPCLAVSVKTGAGMAELRAEIARQAALLPPRPADRPFWMPIDRVFTVNGFGTVVTGTVADGQLSAGDSLFLCPPGEPVRARGLQSGGAAVEAVSAGQRAAVNLAGVKKEQLSRGGVLAAVPAATALLDVRLCVPRAAGRALKHGSRLYLAIGAGGAACRVSLAEADVLRAGETAYAQLRLETPAAARAGDRFVLRFYSPPETAGGGVVLDALPRRRGRLDKTALERLHCYDTGTLRDWLLWEASHSVSGEPALRALFPQQTVAAFGRARDALLADGLLLNAGGLLLPPAALETRERQLLRLLAEFHAENPLADGIPLTSLRRVFPDALTAFFAERGAIEYAPPVARLPGFSPANTPLFHTAREKIRALSARVSGAPLEAERVAQAVELPSETASRVIGLLLERGELVRVSAELLLDAAAYQSARAVFAREAAGGAGVTLARFRDALGVSRKQAQAILERFDAAGYTRRDGELRTLA